MGWLVAESLRQLVEGGRRLSRAGLLRADATCCMIARPANTRVEYLLHRQIVELFMLFTQVITGLGKKC